MKIFLVGGAVRDKILGVSNHDKDYVVVGASPKEMLENGYVSIGKSFPVFIKPNKDGEYALARKEIKTGPRHTDFEFIFDSSIILRDDLDRRDFTCNAIAYDSDTNKYIDYHHGIEDIKSGVLRHVNAEHFVEDPLRILRLCRFAAQLNFSVSTDTMELVTKMVNLGMLQELSKERIWMEVSRALETESFCKFLETAHECGALKKLIPFIDEYFDEKNHNKFIQINTRLNFLKNHEPITKFASLFCELNSQKESEKFLKETFDALSPPTKFKKFTNLVFYNAGTVNPSLLSNSEACIQLFEKFSKDEFLFTEFLSICEADLNAIGQGDDKLFEQMRRLWTKLSKVKATDMPNFSELSKDKTFASHFFKFKADIIKSTIAK